MGLFVSSHDKKMQKLFKLCNEMGGRTDAPLTKPKDLPSDASILKMLRMCITGTVTQALDAQRAIDRTTNPEVFYERVGFLRQRLGYLADIESVDKALIEGKPSAQLKQLDREFPKMEADMWERCFTAHAVKAQQRKTEAAKRKIADEYLAIAQHYEPHVGKKALAVIEKSRASVPQILGT